MARPSIRDAVDRSHGTESAAEVVRPTRKTSSREGKVPISAFFPRDVKASLRLVQAKRGGRLQDLIGEAFNLLFAKYGVPESAPFEPGNRTS